MKANDAHLEKGGGSSSRRFCLEDFGQYQKKQQENKILFSWLCTPDVPSSSDPSNDFSPCREPNKPSDVSVHIDAALWLQLAMMIYFASFCFWFLKCNHVKVLISLHGSERPLKVDVWSPANLGWTSKADSSVSFKFQWTYFASLKYCPDEEK